MKSKLMLIGQR